VDLYRSAPPRLLLGHCPRECTGIAHVVPGGLDLTVGTLDVAKAELVDTAVEGIGDTEDACAGFPNPRPPSVERSGSPSKANPASVRSRACRSIASTAHDASVISGHKKSPLALTRRLPHR
jgi:hypothetical protein